MRWLCDENIPRAIATALAERGHDVVWVGTAAAGSTDATVLTQAVNEQRILLTFDTDFGDLAAHTALPSACGIVLLRMKLHPIQPAITAIIDTLHARADWGGHFSVIEPGRVRMRTLRAI